MKTTFWLLAVGLVLLLAAYNTGQESSGICQLPHTTTYRVLR